MTSSGPRGAEGGGEESAPANGGIITEEGGAPSAGPQTASLRSVLEGVEKVLVYSHINPDPDTIGAAAALRQLLTERYGKQVTLSYRGIVGRAENQQMVRLLAPDMLPVRSLNQADYDVAFLLDAQPDFGILPEDRVPLVGVIDHHPRTGVISGVPLVDVRPEYGATSTILHEYLQAEDVVPTTLVATGLFYGIKTDTQDLSRRAGEPDVAAYNALLPLIDRKILGAIENPPLSREYFDTMVAAVSRSVVYASTVMTELGVMPYPDMVAEIADELIRLEGMEWAVCFGMHDQRIYFSVRARNSGRDAGAVVRQVLNKEGVGGGHDAMAAGRIQLLEESEETYLRVVGELWQRFLDVLGEDPDTGRRLVSQVPAPRRIVGAP